MKTTIDDAVLVGVKEPLSSPSSSSNDEEENEREDDNHVVDVGVNVNDQDDEEETAAALGDDEDCNAATSREEESFAVHEEEMNDENEENFTGFGVPAAAVNSTHEENEELGDDDSYLEANKTSSSTAPFIDTRKISSGGVAKRSSNVRFINFNYSKDSEYVFI